MLGTFEQIFFHWYVKNNSNFSKDDLNNCRLVCRKWNTEISKFSLIYKKLLKYNVYKLLYYDKSVYDEHHIRRLLILKKLSNKYNLKIVPIFAVIEDDLNDSNNTCLVTTLISSELPFEFKVFLELYKMYPSDKIRIYPSEFMHTCSNNQNTLIRNTFLSNNIEEVNKMITVHPLCYSKHYKCDISDKQYINVLCYLNVIGEYGEPIDEFSNEKTSRYFVLILELENLQDDDTHKKLLIDQINIITNNVYINWDYLEDLDLQQFGVALETLIKQQKFNL